MKKVYTDKLSKLLFPFMFFVFAGLTGFAIMAVYVMVTDFSVDYLLPSIMIFTLAVVLDVAALPKMFIATYSKLILYNDYMKWKAPFKKSVILKYDEIKYIGVDSYIIRGKAAAMDEYSKLSMSTYIYFSTEPYWPRRGDELKKVFNEKGIIMFKYSDELCLTLMKEIPLKNKEKLYGFYYKMQDLNPMKKKENKPKKRRKK